MIESTFGEDRFGSGSADVDDAVESFDRVETSVCVMSLSLEWCIDGMSRV